MKPVILLSQRFVQSLQQQVVGLLHTELDLLTTFEFDAEELVAAGWTTELIDQITTVLSKMREQITASKLVTPALPPIG